MLFGSIVFWLLLPVSILMYYLLPKKSRWSILLIGSIAYLGYLSWAFLIYALIFAIANYYFGIMLDKQIDSVKRKRYYILFLFLNIGQIVVYKYFDFLIENVNLLVDLFGKGEIPYMNLLVPIGISYYTFQSIGYVINIYRKHEAAEKHIGYFLIYTLFFPKILSGPIERSEKFLPQLRNMQSISPELLRSGLRLILFGLFKKLVIAERLSVIVYNVYGHIDDYSGIPLLMVMFIQAIYIYTDFSGYTDIALGMANLFGIKLTNNFHRPFFSKNVSEFWRRWHISLSIWCNDYIFKTIIFKRRRWGKKAAVYGVFITFIIIGIWHGPMWTFVILGLLQGIAINYEFFTKRKRLEIGSKIPTFINNSLSRLITFIFFSFSLIFFFSNSFADSIYFVRHLFNFEVSAMVGNNLGLEHKNVFIALIGIIVLFIIEMFEESGFSFISRIELMPSWLKWSIYYIIIFVVLVYGQFATTNFVYFQF